MNGVRDKVAIVTGGSRGIGRAIAGVLGEQGAMVVLAARTPDKVVEAEKELREKGFRATGIPADVSDESSVSNLVRQSVEAYGRVDILVNNAGVGVFKDVADMTIDEFDTMWRTNMRGVFLMTRAVLPLMKKSGGGAVINIASLAGKNWLKGGAGYAATKWALRGFAGSLMLEVRDDNIRVVTICPGSVDTEFSSRRRGRHITQAGDVAEAVLFSLQTPERTMISEIDIRPTRPG